MKLYVKQWRLRRGLTQIKASKRAGIRNATWSHLERGITQRPHATTLEAVARALRVHVMQLGHAPPPLLAKEEK